MKPKNHIVLFLFAVSAAFVSCDKGYTVRFTNYSQQPVDSLIIGNNDVVFTNIEVQSVTEYKPIKKGNYSIECVTKSKNRYFSSFHIPSSGEGTRSVQIDGTNTIVVLEE